MDGKFAVDVLRTDPGYTDLLRPDGAAEVIVRGDASPALLRSSLRGTQVRVA